MSIHIAGGLYNEFCVRPHWNKLYGSAGRAAEAIATMGGEVVFHTYATEAAAKEYRELTALLPTTVTLLADISRTTISFRYLHDSSVPVISGSMEGKLGPIYIREKKVIRFGMLEGAAIVDAEWAVYDPQNAGVAERFTANGSRAKHLALVLNLFEARAMCDDSTATAESCARRLATLENAEVIIIKMGAAGALVWTEAQEHIVPAYRTSSVWKIGSGDTFVAHFSHAWMNKSSDPIAAAELASRATAYYCQWQTMPHPFQLDSFNPEPIKVSPAFLAGKRPQVYLAGPFFDTAQVWFVEEARTKLSEMGFKVFSPFHDIGMGSAADVVKLDIEAIEKSDVVFAIADGLDAGTLYEIGYARALGKKVVVLCERESEESMKMAQGSDCIVMHTFTSALYGALWAGISS